MFTSFQFDRSFFRPKYEAYKLVIFSDHTRRRQFNQFSNSTSPHFCTNQFKLKIFIEKCYWLFALHIFNIHESIVWSIDRSIELILNWNRERAQSKMQTTRTIFVTISILLFIDQKYHLRNVHDKLWHAMHLKANQYERQPFKMISYDKVHFFLMETFLSLTMNGITGSKRMKKKRE